MTQRLSFLLCLLASASACGSSGGEEVMPSPPVITMSGAVEVTGDRSASGSFSTPGHSRQPTCATYAAEGSSADDPGPVEGEGTFRIPGPPIGAPLDPTGDIYASTLKILPAVYQGPGTYVNDDVTDDIQGQIVLEDVMDGPSYFLEDGMATATINADGSGTLTFQDIPEDTEGLPTFISGTVTWTCSEEE